MTNEEVKKLAKEQYGKELTDEQAKALGAVQAESELSEADLEGVSGGRICAQQDHVPMGTTAESLPYVLKQGEEKKKVLGLL